VTGRLRASSPVEIARELGCEAKLSRSGHWRITFGGRFVANVSQSPSDRRTLLNERTRILRKLRQIKEGIKA
jgi:hypothetical protein